MQTLTGAANKTRNTETLFELGLALFLNRDFVKAIDYLDEAIDASGPDTQNLAQIYFIRYSLIYTYE